MIAGGNYMSNNLIKVTVKILANGKAENRIAISLNQDNFARFLQQEKRKNPRHLYGVAEHSNPHNDDSIFQLLTQYKQENKFGVWEDQLTVVAV